MKTAIRTPEDLLGERIKEISGEDYMGCYQCGECSSGCPSADEMDILPNQVNMALQKGQFRRVLDSKTIWICVACYQCGTRCPHGIDIAKINEACRQIVLRENVDLFEMWDERHLDEFPAIALVASFRKLTG